MCDPKRELGIELAKNKKTIRCKFRECAVFLKSSSVLLSVTRKKRTSRYQPQAVSRDRHTLVPKQPLGSGSHEAFFWYLASSHVFLSIVLNSRFFCWWHPSSMIIVTNVQMVAVQRVNLLGVNIIHQEANHENGIKEV